MSSGLKCRNCGSTDIEEDNARGDAVCTNCGSVLEDSLIVSEIQFEEIGHGAAAIGQFVSAESNGGATNYGYGKFQVGSGTESREVTIKKAKKEITHLCQQLQLTQHYIDTALNFFKMALARHLTRGRKSTHIYAACVYITCRTEGTSHLLIDISDVQQICSYELGRTYLKLSNALCINIPSVDPCLYIMRFANKLQFGAKTHEVSMTALRIVQRMKKDSLHSGRRPTGLCGAALLIAARMHEFSRTILDIVGIVKIHESTVRKRLIEFADTPSSALTLDEFMSVDLEAEQDPPAFKAARKKDRDRIKDIGEHELSKLQKEIDTHLEKDLKRIQKNTIKRLTGGLGDIGTDTNFEEVESANFIEESNLEAIKECLADTPDVMGPQKTKKIVLSGLKPDIESMCRPAPSELLEVEKAKENDVMEDLDLEGLDDEEINNYILTHEEAEYKNNMWNALNAEYLKEMREKEERLAKEREEGKPEKKKRRPRRKPIGPSTSAGEAIEKMLQEKKISSKINYDILRTLTEGSVTAASTTAAEVAANEALDVKNVPIIETGPIKQKNSRAKPAYTIGGPAAKVPKLEMGLPVAEEVATPTKQEPVVVENDDLDEFVDDADADGDAEVEPEPEREYSSLKDMLNDGEEDDYYGYDDY
ncbi:transcription factor IIIB 90 kDa subunit [Bactrocera neohumeralis]|uniref:transcription factor IIIB 90 kDa subunit n=1 Tax=Bactrocera tryoni TaxID=59916 RepID=UPI001A960280|nr:transcription factor IIIB 90 kDa subunit [Bactrocera tryoni]XP_050318008.1 transcription factor IIIB 90 kDa subunit [Bactrocera neohumeralis]